MADPSSAPEQVDLIFRLIQQNNTLRYAKDFLAERRLHFSASSWREFIENRLSPAFVNGDVSRDDLIDLLSEGEEHARQHIFLYQTDQQRAEDLTDRKRIRALLKERGQIYILERPRVLNTPPSPQIVQMRWQEEKFVVKITETRVHLEQLERIRRDDEIITRAREIRTRAVNLFQLHSDGLLEMRLQSHKNSTQYQEDIERMWEVVSAFLPQEYFEQWPIAIAKNRFAQNPDQLEGGIEHKNIQLRNDEGVSMSVATPTNIFAIFDSRSASASIQNFLPDASCEKVNLTVYDPHDEWAESGVHVRLAGLDNEFAITAACSRQGYEYVLQKIREYNKSDTD